MITLKEMQNSSSQYNNKQTFDTETPQTQHYDAIVHEPSTNSPGDAPGEGEGDVCARTVKQAIHRRTKTNGCGSNCTIVSAFVRPFNQIKITVFLNRCQKHTDRTNLVDCLELVLVNRLLNENAPHK